MPDKPDYTRKCQQLDVLIDLLEGENKRLREMIVYCKDCTKHNKDYHESPYKDTVCPLTAWRGKAKGHEFDYQFCCFAERREVTDGNHN